MMKSYLQTISMNIELCHRFTPDVDVFNLLRGDVLALRQLKDVLFPVDDLQRAILQQAKLRKHKKNDLHVITTAF